MSGRAVAVIAKNDPTGLALPDVRPLTTALSDEDAGGIQKSIVSLARKMADPMWGSEGDIKGMEAEIDVWRLWINPLQELTSQVSVTYTEAEIQAAALSLRETGGAVKPLIVTKMDDPRGEANGGVGGDHLVIDGELTLLAATYAQLEHLPVVYRSYTSFWEAMRDSVAAKTAAHVYNDSDIGRLICQLVIAHRATRDRRPDLQLGKLTQEEVGRIVGRSQPEVSRWLALADSTGRFWNYLVAGEITSAAAKEFLSLPQQQRDEAADILVQKKRETGRPATQREAREVAQRHRRPSAPRYAKSLSDTPTHPPVGLWIPDLVNYPSPTAIGALIHDLTLWLEQTKATRGNLDRDAQRLLDTLNAEALQEHARQVAGNF